MLSLVTSTVYVMTTLLLRMESHAFPYAFLTIMCGMKKQYLYNKAN